MQTDNDLVLATLKNPDRYSDIIDRYESPIIRYIRRMIGDEHETNEDIAQEVFIKAYKSLHGYNPKLKFSSWLYRIAHNLCVDYLRKNSKKHHMSLDLEDEESQSLIEKIASEENITHTLATQETRQAVQTLIQALPEKYKTVIILAYIEEKSYDEISDILEIPIGTV